MKLKEKNKKILLQTQYWKTKLEKKIKKKINENERKKRGAKWEKPI